MDKGQGQPAREDELGALWKKSNDKGEFFTGAVTLDGVKIDIVVFPNGYKREERHPDFRILKAKGERRPQPAAPTSGARTVEPDDDRIPF